MQKYLHMCDFFCTFGHLPCSAHLHSLRNKEFYVCSANSRAALTP